VIVALAISAALLALAAFTRAVRSAR